MQMRESPEQGSWLEGAQDPERGKTSSKADWRKTLPPEALGKSFWGKQKQAQSHVGACQRGQTLAQEHKSRALPRVIGPSFYRALDTQRRAAAAAAPTWQVQIVQRRAGGGGRDRRPLPPLSGASLRPTPAPARSSTARGRARLPGGGGPLVAAGKRGRRPSGELAFSRPLAGVRGSRRALGGSGGASWRRRRFPSASGRTERGRPEGGRAQRRGGRAQRRGGREAGETAGRRTEPGLRDWIPLCSADSSTVVRS
nr:translation initiation factor IF-2-like [Saimiri boliviensis boliviensis]